LPLSTKTVSLHFNAAKGFDEAGLAERWQMGIVEGDVFGVSIQIGMALIEVCQQRAAHGGSIAACGQHDEVRQDKFLPLKDQPTIRAIRQVKR
jgi:hypothetical protein